MLTLEDLRHAVELGELDTVVVAFTDMQGRLMGKRLQAEFFVEEMEAGHAVEGCNYLLALDMEMDPQPGYAMASWEQGYGDFDMAPDLSTLRRIPWLEGTALVLCDVLWHDGKPVAPSPRATGGAAGWRGRAAARSRRSRAPSSPSRSPAAGSSPCRARAGSCSPRPRGRRPSPRGRSRRAGACPSGVPACR